MSDGPVLVVEEDDRIHRLHVAAAVLGRSKSCDLSFDRAGVSRRHCEIVVRGDGALVRDLGSSHGTFLDGRRVRGESPVSAGHVIRLGPRGPRIRIVEVSAAASAPVSDDPALPEASVFDPDDIVSPTETADRPPAPLVADTESAEPPARPATAVAAVPRRPPPKSAPEAVPPAPADGFAMDLALGLALGVATGIVLLVAVDLAPVRAALGLD